jgi:hypothetical protein
MQECACIIQSNGLGRQPPKGAVQHAGNERCKSWCLVLLVHLVNDSENNQSARGRGSRQQLKKKKKITWGGEMA